MLLVGGWCSGDAIASVEMFDPATNDWKAVAPMSKRRCGVGVSVLNNLLYAVGGHDGVSYLNSVERFVQHRRQRKRNRLLRLDLILRRINGAMKSLRPVRVERVWVSLFSMDVSLLSVDKMASLV